MIQLYMEGVDIAPRMGIKQVIITDCAGGQLDSLEVELIDAQGIWSQWQPQIGNRMRLVQDGFDSGECYIDQPGQRRGVFILRALSAPLAVKEIRSRSWEQVTLLQLVADVAGRYGFGVRLYDAPNPTYAWVDQTVESDLSFMQRRCRLEGCTLKVTDRHLVIYSERQMESAAPTRVIRLGDFAGDPEYRRQSGYAQCVVEYAGHRGEFAPPGLQGSTLYRGDILCSSVGEAQRFAAGLLREANREEHVVMGGIRLDLSLAGGSMVQVTDMGTGDGVYMIDEVEHRLTDQITALRLRRRLEGY